MSETWVTRNHYNPCFWTAYWNPVYYAGAISGSTGLPSARDQVVYSLNVKADKILDTVVANVHYDKGFGPAEISYEAAEDYVRRYHPEELDNFRRKSSAADYPVFINFEQILTALEELEHYDHLRAVIAQRGLASPMDKGMIACVVYLQAMRSHALMNSLLEWHESLGIKKFEFFVSLKRILSNIELLAEVIAPLALSHWVLYRTAEPTFPLTDSCVLFGPHSIMMALSPYLLLEIQRNRAAPESQWHHKNGIKRGKLAEFRRRTIGNTFREIIFSDRSTLLFWQQTKEFRDRVSVIRDMKRYNQLVEQHDNRELWLINALGNRS